MVVQVKYLALSLLAVLSGCNPSDTQQVAISPEVEARLSQLEKNDEAHKDKFAKLIMKVAELKRDAYIKVSDSGFAAFDTEVGVMLGSIKDIQPFGSGSKVSLEIGNATAVNVVGLKFKVNWYLDNALDVKSKESQFVETFRPGAWTTVELVLDDTPPAKVGVIELTNAQIRTVELRSIR